MWFLAAFLSPLQSVALYRIITTLVSLNIETICLYSMFEGEKENRSKACIKVLIM